MRRARRNPASIPTDLYGPNLSAYEAGREYLGILQEALRQAGERVWRLGQDLAMLPAREAYPRITERLGAITRDLLASWTLATIVQEQLFKPDVYTRGSFGHPRVRAYNLTAYQREMEERAQAFERWFRAAGQSLASEDVRTWATLRGASPQTAKLQAAYQHLRTGLTKAQAHASSENMRGVHDELWTAFEGVSDLLRELGLPTAADMVREVFQLRPHYFLTFAKQAERDLKRGSKPAPGARKAARAEENHLAAMDRGEPRYPDELVRDKGIASDEPFRMTVQLGTPSGARPAVLLVQFHSRSPVREWAAPKFRIPLTQYVGGRFDAETHTRLRSGLYGTVEAAYSLLAGAYQREGVPLRKVFDPGLLAEIAPA